MTLERFISVVKRRFVVVMAVLAIGLALMYSFRNAIPNSFAGVAHVVLVAESGARDPSVSIVDLPSIATSTVVLERVRDSLKLPLSLIALKANVSASVLGHSSIMAIGFRDASAERAIAVSNAVSDELSRYYDEISTQRYDVNVSRLSSQMAAQSTKIRALDGQISHVIASNPYVISDRSVDTLTTAIGTLEEQRGSLRAQLSGDRAIADTLAPSVTLSKIARHEILANDPAYNAKRIQAAKDSAQLAADLATYTKSYPGLPGAVAKIDGENEAIDSEASHALGDPNAFSSSEASTQQQYAHQLALVHGDEARVAQIDGVIATQQQRLNDLPTIGSTYTQLSNQRAALLTEYTTLANRRATALANRAEASSLGSVVVLDRAIKADTQLAGGRTRAALLSAFLVLAAALGAAFLVDSLDPRLSRPEDIEQLYGIPVVSTLGAR